MRPSPHRIIGPRALVLSILLLLAACAAPAYDPQIDDQITSTQTLANGLIERLIGLDEELRLLPAQPTDKADRALLAKMREDASYRANRPAYEELRTHLIGLQTRMGARGSASTPQILETVKALRAVLVAPPGPGEPATSLQARHAAAGRVSAAFLMSTQAQANALFETLLRYEMTLK